MSAYGFLFLLTFLTSLRPSIQQPRPEYVGYDCRGRHTYLKNSTYFSNLKYLLLVLSSTDNNYFFSTGFQSLPMGENPDKVYGLYLCRGDLSLEVCRDCVNFAVKDVLNQCPNRKEALIYYDKCMLRYADQHLLLDPVTTAGQLMENQNTVPANQSDRFSKVLLSLMNEVVEEVASSPRKFAFNKDKYTSSQTVYVLGQCTPDLSRENCSSCLKQAIKKLPRNKIGARILWPSCNLRYEPNLFYNETFSPLPSPHPGKSSPSLSVNVFFGLRSLRFRKLCVMSDSKLNAGKGKKAIVIIIAIVVLLAVSAMLFIACYCFRAKRAKRTYETAAEHDGNRFQITLIFAT